MRLTLPKMATQAAQKLSRPDPATRLYLLIGPDVSGARALAEMFIKTMPADAERIDLGSGQLKQDPALLADEAASMSLFGGARYIVVSLGDSGEEVVGAVESLLANAVPGNPVLLVGGNIRLTSKLVKLVEGNANTLTCYCYAPDARDMAGIIREQATALGLRMDSQTTRVLTEYCGDDRGLTAQELEKLSLYLDASPDSPKSLTMDALLALGADTVEEDLAGAVDAMLGGKSDSLTARLTELEAAGVAAIRVLRALSGRAELLARLRPDVDQGRTPKQVVDAAGKAIFWKDQDAVADQLRRWNSPRLARLFTRINATEAALKAPHTPGFILLRHMAADITRQAAG